MTRTQLVEFLTLARRFRQTPIVDDDFPSLRDQFDAALTAAINEINRQGAFPEVVTLCGSTRFREAFEREQARLTDAGVVVLSVGRFGHLDGLDMAGGLKQRLDELHKRKLDLSDRAHIINDQTYVCDVCGKACSTFYDPCGGYHTSMCCVRPCYKRPYVGESTRGEIAYAQAAGKKVTYLNPPEE